MNAPREVCWSDRALSDSLEPGAEIPAHVRGCVSCRVRRDGLARAARALRAAEPAPPSEAERAVVRDAVLAAVLAHPVRRAWPRAAVAAAAAMLIAVGAAAGFWAATPADEARVEPMGDAHFTRQRTRVGAGVAEDEVVMVTDGRLHVSVGALAPERRFRVLTVDAELDVRAAELEVEVIERRLTAVHVVHGMVGVRRVGQPAEWLSAGERWPRDTDRTPARAPTAAVSGAGAADHGHTEHDALGDGARAGAPAAGATPIAPTPRPTPRSTLAAAPIAAARNSARPAATPTAPSPEAVAEPRASDAPARPVATTTAGLAGRAARPPVDAARAADDVTPPIAEPPAAEAAPPMDRAALEEAAEQEFRRGWERLRVHAPARAARHFERAAQLLGEGALAEDARYWRAMSLAEADDAAADEACRDFLRRYPRSARWDVLALRLAARRMSSDPAEARALLQRVAAEGRGDRPAQARALLEALGE